MHQSLSIAHGLFIHSLYSTLLVTVCLYSAKYGDSTERLGALLFTSASLSSGIIVYHKEGVFASLEQGLFAIDVITWIGLIYLALTSNRFWPIWATSFQTIAIVTHLAVEVDRAIVPKAYAIGQGLWAYPILVALLVGSERCRRLRLERQATVARC